MPLWLIFIVVLICFSLLASDADRIFCDYFFGFLKIGQCFTDTIIQIENISDVAHIGEYEGLYTFSGDGSITEWEGIRVNEAGQIVLDSSLSEWDSDLQFTQLSFGGQFVIGLDVEGNVYYWGCDFTREMKNKADYTIYSTPQLLELDKPVDSVYAAGDIAFFKNGMELYVILKD